MNIALILAGGIGSRFDSNYPKQFVEIEKKPLIVHTLEKFSNCDEISEIYIVCLKDYVAEMEYIINNYSIDKVKSIIIGGKTRHESIKNGIKYLESKNFNDTYKVIIHNANMPLVTKSNIIDCINKCNDENIIVTTAATCNGYFYQISNSKDGNLMIGPNRENLLHAKVPEAMYFKTSKDLYLSDIFDEKKYESYTAGMLGIILNKKVEFVKCKSTNMKITTKEDYELVQTYLKKEKMGE